MKQELFPHTAGSMGSSQQRVCRSPGVSEFSVLLPSTIA